MEEPKVEVKIIANDQYTELAYRGGFVEVCAVATSALIQLIRRCGENMEIRGATVALFHSAIKALQREYVKVGGKDPSSCQCACKKQDKEAEQPGAKHMTPEEFADFQDTWMREATLEERNELFVINLRRFCAQE